MATKRRLFAIAKPTGIIDITMQYERLYERLSTADRIFAEAAKIAAAKGERMQVSHRDNGEWKETAVVWPDGKVDISVTGCAIA